MNDSLIIIPAYNEEMNLGNVILDIKNSVKDIDILVVNDCSKDNTLGVIDSISGIQYLNLPVNLGYAGAIQAGFKYALKRNYKFVIQFDADGQHLASEINKLYNKIIEEKLDIVIGSRFLEKTDYDHSLFRMLGTKLFSYIIKKSCRIDISDPTSGFQILHQSVYERLAKMNNYPEYPDANLLIDLLLQDIKIGEVQVEMKNREFGDSMHSGVIRPIKYMVKIFYSIMLILVGSKLTLKRNKPA